MCRMIKESKKWNGYICHCHNEPELFLAQNVQSLNVVSFKSRFISKYPISSPRAAFIQSFESWESVPHNTGRGLDNSDTGILTAARMLEILHVNIQGVPQLSSHFVLVVFSASRARTEEYFTIFQQPRRCRFQNSPYFPPYLKNWSSYSPKRETNWILKV